MGDAVTVLFRGYTVSVCISRVGQLSLLPSAGWEMSTYQRAVKLCGWKVTIR